MHTGDSDVGFTSREIGYVEESVVEGGVKVAHGEHVLVLSAGAQWAVIGNLLLLGALFFLFSLLSFLLLRLRLHRRYVRQR